MLNAVSINTDIATLHTRYFGADQAQLSAKLDILLTWAISPTQYGHHRHYLVVTIISAWCDQQNDRDARRQMERDSGSTPNEVLQDALFDFLDKSDMLAGGERLGDTALLFGQLGKAKLFSFAAYLQRLVARGEPGLSFTNVSSHHSLFIGDGLLTK